MDLAETARLHMFLVFVLNTNTKSSLTCKEGVMRSKGTFLKTISLLVFFLALALPAMATDSYVEIGLDKEWNWTATGVAITFNSSATDIALSSNYKLIASDGITDLVIFSGTLVQDGAYNPNSLGGSISISGNTAYVTNTMGQNVGSLNVSSGYFKLLFSAADVEDPTYDVFKATTVANSYKLVADNGLTAFISSATGGSLTVSAVPVPGSALLLGSSILGLVGISTRRKKA